MGDKDSASIEGVLDDLAGYLEHRIEEGERTVEMSRDSLDALRAEPAPAAPASSAGPSLDELVTAIAGCTQCCLHETRTQTVPGQGAAHPEIMFVGEAPGRDEDLQGLAFVGRAGKLLTKMIEAMGYTRDEVFIGNILKCRPPNNRPPTPEEMATCMPYLKAQIAQLQPKAIITLGATASKGLLDVSIGISKLRGFWMSFEGIDLMPTYHPAYLLRNPSAKRQVWEDLQEVLRHLGRKPPPVQKKQ